jgi:hypothetical protein
MRHRKSRLLVWIVSSLFVALGQVPAPAEPPGDPAEVGRWLAPFSEDGAFDEAPPDTEAESALYPTAVSIAVLPNGRILYWNGLEGTENFDALANAPAQAGGSLPNPENSRSRVLDLSDYLEDGADPGATATWSIPDPEDGGGGDLFCADQRHLAGGQVIAAGGTDWVDELGNPYGQPPHSTELFGRKNVRVYDPKSNSWTQKSDMNFARWYPTLLTLPDEGRLLVASGVRKLIKNTDGDNVNNTEVYDVKANTWTDNGASGKQSLPLYARLHLLPNGEVFYDATGQMWTPFGQSLFQGTWSLQKLYDPETNSWTDLDLVTPRSGVFSTMLTLEPPYDEAKLLIGGGTLGVSPGSFAATNMTEIATWSSAAAETVTRERAADLNRSRWFSSGVLAPTGEVIALSGADKDEVIDPGSGNAVMEAEMYDPETDTWALLAPGARQRTYHNTAVLLPDASILVGGHSPLPLHYNRDHETLFSNNFKDPSFEIFQPPYLFRGDRPEIDEIPRRDIRRGAQFPIETHDARNPTLEVVLSRLPATTHVTDADQRTVELPIVRRGSGAVTVRIPSNRAVLPPGPYYLFLLKDNGEGPTPSHAKIVRVH